MSFKSALNLNDTMASGHAHRFRKSIADPLAEAAPRSELLGSRAALAIGLVSAFVFVGLASINLSAQGLYYDEIHQAPAAFAYQGRHPQLFARAFVQGKPLMTMSYSGAIKPAVYGLYLRFTGASFTVESWRWLGIAIVATSFPLFALLSRRHLSAIGLGLFFVLLMTDTTVVLGTRHDWGPSALALALRLMFLGTWLHGLGKGAVPARNSFRLGALVGLSIYEKLSNIVLLPALAIFMVCRERRSLKHWTACLAGGLIAGMPLLYVNALNYVQRGRLLSTSQVAAQGTKSLVGLLNLLRDCLALGDGELVRGFILGNTHGFAMAEALLLGIALIAIVGIRPTIAIDRLPAILLACYVTIVAGLYALPNSTGSHHWVIGTPFPYLALALAIKQPDRSLISLGRIASMSRAILFASVSLLLVVRAHGSFELTHALADGNSSSAWNPSLTRLGEFAARRAGKDLFVAGNWGVATQMYCLSNGHPYAVREILEWPPSPPLEKWLKLGAFRSVYVVLRDPQSFPDPSVTQLLINSLNKHPAMREVPAEIELASLTGIKVRKFVRSPDEAVPRSEHRTVARGPRETGLARD